MIKGERSCWTLCHPIVGTSLGLNRESTNRTGQSHFVAQSGGRPWFPLGLMIHPSHAVVPSVSFCGQGLKCCTWRANICSTDSKIWTRWFQGPGCFATFLYFIFFILFFFTPQEFQTGVWIQNNDILICCECYGRQHARKWSLAWSN